MKISRSRYQNAKNTLEKMDSLRQIVRIWESALQGVRNELRPAVRSISISKGGHVSTEFDANLMGAAGGEGALSAITGGNSQSEDLDNMKEVQGDAIPILGSKDVD